MGIEAIFQSAGKLQGAIHESSPALPVVLREFSLELDRQVQAIQGALSDSTPVQPGGEGDQAFDPGEVRAIVGRLSVLLEARDGDAVDAYRTLAEALRDTPDATHLDALGAAVNAFEYDAAQRELDEIAKHLAART